MKSANPKPMGPGGSQKDRIGEDEKDMRRPAVTVGGKSTTGINQASAATQAGTDPTMAQIFKPSKRVGMDNSVKPAPVQPKAKRRFKIGREEY
jgi:hypothetical protein